MGSRASTWRWWSRSRKQICTSRAFPTQKYELSELEEFVASFASIDAAKLRKQKGCAASLTVSIQTNPIQRGRRPVLQQHQREDAPRRHRTRCMIVKAALTGLRTIFRNGYGYKRASVIITEIVNENEVQGNLFVSPGKRRQRKELMRVVDGLNSGFVKNDIRLAVQGNAMKYLKRDMLSPCYTTKMSDVIKVKCTE
jgi:DNA polymerase V